MKGVGDIILHKLGAQWKGTPSYCDFLLVFFHIIRRKDQGGHNMINMTIRELYYIFADVLSLYNIHFAERNSEAAMGGGGYIF
jgi:hypothetical protein